MQKSVLCVLITSNITHSESFATQFLLNVHQVDLFNLSCSGDFSPPIWFYLSFCTAFTMDLLCCGLRDGVSSGVWRELSSLIGTSTWWHSCFYPCFGRPPGTLAHGQAIQAHREKKKGVASFRGFSLEQLPLVRQLYLKPVRRGEVQCRQQLLHLLLVAQPSVDNPKLFIHTEALVVPGREVDVGAEVGPALGWVISLYFTPSHDHFIF